MEKRDNSWLIEGKFGLSGYVEQGAKVPETYLKAFSQILETGLMQTVQKVTTNKMETFDREKLGLPKIKYPTETFKAIFLKALEEHGV